MKKNYYCNFLKRNAWLDQFTIRILLVVFTLGIAGCSGSLSIDNDTITSQITDYLNNDSRDGFMSHVRFAEWFYIEDITVIDKLIKDQDKECTALVAITVSINKPFSRGSGVTDAYGFIIGNIAGQSGQVVTGEAKFLFEKYESGWRIARNLRN